MNEKLTEPSKAWIEIYVDDFGITTKKYRWREAGVGTGYWPGDVWVEF